MIGVTYYRWKVTFGYDVNIRYTTITTTMTHTRDESCTDYYYAYVADPIYAVITRAATIAMRNTA